MLGWKVGKYFFSMSDSTLDIEVAASTVVSSLFRNKSRVKYGSTYECYVKWSEHEKVI